VDPRARWQSLQAHLSAARFALKMGDRDRAREEVQTALSIDPEFLAARMLRDELDAPPAPSPAVAATPSARPKQDAAPVTRVPVATPVASLAASSAKIAELEARVKQRVQDRHIVVPPAAPKRPTAAYRLRTGAAAVAAAAFLAAMSGSKISEPRTLLSRGSVSIASLMESAAPSPIDIGVVIPDDEPIVEERPFMRPVARPAAVAVSAPIPPQPQLAIPPPPQVLPTPSAVVTDSPPPAFVPRTVDERTLVEDALCRYRRAYNRLDARSAQAVYPAVNAPALARAFDGLESQSLQFDECEIDVRGGLANVTCRGSSRYVTKIGSRDPHVEPRTWDFTLRKDQGDWKIENARAGR